MADMEFDLGEALGGYEQAQADRNFYLSMVQGGTQAASPIAAYLAGVSGVKMANMRQQAQDVQDARQAKLDAAEAADKAQKREQGLQNQVINIMKGTRDGSLAPGAAAAMLGKIAPELGFQMVSFDADNQIAHVKNVRDGQDYQWDLGESETSKNQRDWYKLQLAREAEARRERQGNRSLDIQQQRANTQAANANKQNQTDPWTTFKEANKDTLDYLQMPIEDAELADMLPRRAAIDFIAGAEELPETRKKTLGSQINRLKFIYKISPEEIKGAENQPVDLNSLW